MAGRFPGAPSAEQFWQNLVEGVESVEKISEADLLAAGIPLDVIRDPNYVNAVTALDDIDAFDAGFFEIGPREARMMDPQQRIFLECAWEAIEDAGHPLDAISARTGVFVGKSVSNYDYPYPDLTQPALFF
jgi:acyl transferase domain-containing protein